LTNTYINIYIKVTLRAMRRCISSLRSLRTTITCPTMKARCLEPREDDELARLSFLQSRCDPGQEYYKFSENQKDQEKKEEKIFVIPDSDVDSDLAWRHAIYDPPMTINTKI